MLTEQDFIALRANQGYLAEELQKRGVLVKILDLNNELIFTEYAGRSEIIFGIDSAIMPYSSSIVAGSKSITKRLLNASGIAVPKGHYFSSEQLNEITDYSKSNLKFPIVVKPSVGDQGKDVHTGIDNVDELLHSLISIQENLGACEVVVEEHFQANEYRLFITKNGKYAAVLREPANIIGDGSSTILELVNNENLRRQKERSTCLGKIILDSESSRHLRKCGLELNSIPSSGHKVYLRDCSNVKLGGIPVDVTDSVHPGYVNIGLKALKAISNLPYAGLDIMTADISVPPVIDNYKILEVNSVPGLGIHMAPAKGKARNVAAMLADLIYPETINTINFKVAA